MRTRKKICDMNVAVVDRQNLPALLASGKIAAQADEDYQINQKTVKIRLKTNILLPCFLSCSLK